jgi:hypothetical protein
MGLFPLHEIKKGSLSAIGLLNKLPFLAGIKIR